MKIVLATSNQGKVAELKEMLDGFNVLALSQVCQSFDIAETGSSFSENALIKARAVYDRLAALGMHDAISLSDDSGICVDVLNGEPGIYSARYFDGTEAGNRSALQAAIKAHATSSKAHYSAAIAIVSPFGEYVSHGFMHGQALSYERGSGGFGYDSMFIPDGFKLTLAQLPDSIKSSLSHRSKAVKNILSVLKMLDRKFKSSSFLST